MDLWSFARYTLRLSEEDFWRLTLRKLAALRRRHDAECKRIELKIEQTCGIIVAAVVNSSMCRSGKALEFWRFMPSNWGKEEEMEQRQAEADVRSVFSRMVGNGE